MVVNSLRTGLDYSLNPGAIPSEWTLDNLRALLSGNEFYGWLINSIVLTTFSVVISIIIAVTAAYALTLFRFRLSGPSIRLISTLMIIPPILIVVPLFVEFARLGLIDSYVGPVLIYTGLLLPFSIYLLARFIAVVPNALLEAAIVDGAGPIQVLRRIVVPLIRPALLTIAIVNAFFVWNDLLIALIFLQTESLRPLMVGLTTLAGRQTRNVPLVTAGLLLSVIPIVLLYAVFERRLVRGFSEGALGGE